MRSSKILYVYLFIFVILLVALVIVAIVGAPQKKESGALFIFALDPVRSYSLLNGLDKLS